MIKYKPLEKIVKNGVAMGIKLTNTKVGQKEEEKPPNQLNTNTSDMKGEGYVHHITIKENSPTGKIFKNNRRKSRGINRGEKKRI